MIKTFINIIITIIEESVLTTSVANSSDHVAVFPIEVVQVADFPIEVVHGETAVITT